MAFSIFGILAVLLEVIRPLLWLLVFVVLVDMLLLALAWREPARARWRQALMASVVSGGLLTVLAFLSLPALTGASFADLAGWLDYLALSGLSVGVGAALAVFSYPAWQLLFRV